MKKKQRRTTLPKKRVFKNLNVYEMRKACGGITWFPIVIGAPIKAVTIG